MSTRNEFATEKAKLLIKLVREFAKEDAFVKKGRLGTFAFNFEYLSKNKIKLYNLRLFETEDKNIKTEIKG